MGDTKSTNLTEYVETARLAVSSAGDYLLSEFMRIERPTKLKDDGSVSSPYDIEAERIIRREIETRHRGAFVVSEESETPWHSDAPVCWLVDPLDGTDNYVAGLPFFSSAVGARTSDGHMLAVAINVPFLKTTYWADRQGRSDGILSRQRAFPNAQTRIDARISFIPTYQNRFTPLVRKAREGLQTSCRRVVDTWCPSMDWILLASGHIDGIISCFDGPQNFDSIAGQFLFVNANGAENVVKIDIRGDIGGATFIVAAIERALFEELQEFVWALADGN